MIKKITHALLPDWQFLPETIQSITKRYTGFGHELFQQLKKSYPDVYSRLLFYRSYQYQTEDVFAVYKKDNTEFVIQLDADCEVIVLRNYTIQTEIGNWSHDACKEAINFIKNNFIYKS
jgi:hypothetical protein